MTFKYSLGLILGLTVWANAQTHAQAQTAPTSAAPPNTSTSPGSAITMDEILNRVVANEKALVGTLANYSPMVETYVQNLVPDKVLGSVPKSDRYFLGKLDLKDGVNEQSLLPAPGFADNLKSMLSQIYSVRYLPQGFAQMILVDRDSFDRSTYEFEFVRREFLGEVRCLVFEVTPGKTQSVSGFQGRIWVEDQGYNVVRFNGTYTGSSPSKLYFHFDSWREQMGPGLWLPAYIYSEESDLGYFFGTRKLQFKGQTRFWGYNVARNDGQSEFTSLTVEADKIEDNGDAVEHMSPVLSLRAWERQAEDNVLHRMQKARLLAPEGEVDKVLQTVVTNLEVTNNLSSEPGTRTRVLLTAPLESFSIGHTIVLSRGLVDVLPDEASLAMVLAHELAHISLGHRLDTKYAFNDRMQFDDTKMFNHLNIKRNEKEERDADQKAMEFLKNSPYKDKLANAGLFLRALYDSADALPNLLKAHVGSPMTDGKNNKRMADLMQSAPKLEAAKVDQIAALPLGGRLRLDPWSNRLEMVKAKPVSILFAHEKMPFQVTPVFIYLMRQKEATASASKGPQ